MVKATFDAAGLARSVLSIWRESGDLSSGSRTNDPSEWTSSTTEVNRTSNLNVVRKDALYDTLHARRDPETRHLRWTSVIGLARRRRKSLLSCCSSAGLTRRRGFRSRPSRKPPLESLIVKSRHRGRRSAARVVAWRRWPTTRRAPTSRCARSRRCWCCARGCNPCRGSMEAGGERVRDGGTCCRKIHAKVH